MSADPAMPGRAGRRAGLDGLGAAALAAGTFYSVAWLAAAGSAVAAATTMFAGDRMLSSSQGTAGGGW